MLRSRVVPETVVLRFFRKRLLLLTCLLGWTGAVHAFGFGHARLVSSPQQALRADVPIVRLSAQELVGLQVNIAPEDAWREAGLTPPVDLSSLRVQLRAGLTDDTRMARITSSQRFTGTVADFLVDVQTTTGVQRHQVSVLVQSRALVLAGGVAHAVASSPASVMVRRGDTLFFIAQRHTVTGFSDYQMMAALFHANPSAFIDGNMHLVKAGLVLRLPDVASLSRLTDRQARQLFIQHAHARQRGRGAAAVAVENLDGVTPILPTSSLENAPTQRTATRLSQDQLALRVEDVGEGSIVGMADVDSRPPNEPFATRMAVQDSLGRIAQLEDNIQELNQVLQQAAQTQARIQARRPPQEPLDMTAREGASLVRQDAVKQDSLHPEPQTALGGGGTGALVGKSEVVTQAGQIGNGLVAQPSTPRTAQTPVSSDAVTPVVAGANATGTGAAVDAPLAPTAQTVPQTIQQGTGLHNSLWMMIVAGLALFVSLIVWLRRCARAGTRGDGKITDAMIQEKLRTIDLDLREDDAPAHRS